jgi:Ni/Co efflux regulator RcnB
MAEEQELESKITAQLQELEGLKQSTQKISEENRILEEQRDRTDSQLQQKKKELDEKKEFVKKFGGKEHRPQGLDINDAERREKEIDDWIREKLVELVEGENIRRSGVVEAEDRTLLINSVVMRYVPDVHDGDVESFDKSDPQEGVFRLCKETTFRV